MNGYLFDTDVISLLAPGRTSVPEGFAAWAEALDSEGRVFLSAVSVHELEKGVRLLEARGAQQKARALDSWLRPLVARHAGVILPVDAEVARVSGELEARAIAAGFNSGASDAMIAGTAHHHELILLTRNVKHFEPFGIDVVAASAATGLPS
ncbi:MAG: type II toxin-antitoxin system VapC family toxin [Hoeflea sp.]|uniref:type II toxin-antitoxin system VapC family toxin n=1 Tax=Hoeflea sp. TaxID=1940281 RepID=UPI001DEA16F9|nr:type II toxin-antitoxin system VapC family toxin [Hoeflea sp.]MBU4528461.1 type II toxin-antitoxin system VapC family toxin [Alphaproteobacteria bacterium]MBU4543130.1 type II toxin-antitoxin system VapC family toxin [Alphaproteobacteria bacterium]MBU4551821.1 type II toxin-antitoxin system VapC family toxin [Alphaproteobacteria bacterium]MBV1723716.1 type II toxin-antitoxin system VapC family toxin [Hoeflea sp.]MBV1762032.1 type II toxin-antitoxin system VapC family toxin [Hoeflea sp.]